MASASLHLPLVAWHQYTNRAKVTSLAYHAPFVYAGQSDGLIWVYTLNETTFKPKFLFTGHKHPVTALCVLEIKAQTPASVDTEGILVSADASGEIAKWNIHDGRCQAVNSFSVFSVPTALKVFPELSSQYIFCYGQSNDICILNASTLDVVRVWGGHPNWAICTSYFDPLEKRLRLITATVEGQLDRWDVETTNMTVYKDKQSVQHDSIAQVDGIDERVIDLLYDTELTLFILLTNRKILAFQLIDTGSSPAYSPHFTLYIDKETQQHQQQGTSRPRDDWAGAKITQTRRLYAWTTRGDVYDYVILPSKGVPVGSVVSNDGQIYDSAKLLNAYLLSDELDGWSMTLPCHLSDDCIALLTMLNRDDTSLFSLDRLHLDNSDPMPTPRAKAIPLASIWPVTANSQPCKQSGLIITTTIPVSSNHLAIGYENGTIVVVPLSVAILFLNEMPKHIDQRQDTRVFERAHDGKVTSLLVPDHHHAADPKYLLSGGRDGCVKIWNLINGKFVASFAVHASPVKMFVEPAEQKDVKIRSCVVSIAHDNSIALISVESMTCLYILPGYSYPLMWIQWRAAEDLVLFGYSNDCVFVWELQAGHLDRVLDGKTARHIMQDDRYPINHLNSVPGRKQSASQTIQTRGITSMDNDMYTSTLVAQVFHINVRRLCHELRLPGASDVYTNARQAYQQQQQHQQQQHQMVPSMSASSADTSVTAQLLSSPLPPSSSLFMPSVSLSSPSSQQYMPDKSDPLDIRLDDDLDTAHAIKNDHALKKRELASAIMSILLSLGVESQFESHCKQQWIMDADAANRAPVAFGIRGPQNYLSLVVPTTDHWQSWATSSTVTAMRLLAIAFLMDAVDADGTTMGRLAGYFATLPDRVGPSWEAPSLSYLCRYWQDEKARKLFSLSVTQLDKVHLHALVSYWRAYLPVCSAKNDADVQAMMTRATIVLALIGCDNPLLLDDSARKETALSLTLLLSDTDVVDVGVPQGASSGHGGAGGGHSQVGSGENGHGVITGDMGMQLTKLTSSMQLLSEGCQTWEAYINTSTVLRTIFAYASSPVATFSSSSAPSATAAQTAGGGGPSTSSTTAGSGNITTAGGDAHQTGAGGGHAGPAAANSHGGNGHASHQHALMTPLLAAMPANYRQTVRQYARQAIFTFARNNHMPLVIGTLIYDIIHTKSIDKRLGYLGIISSFTRKNPMLLHGHVHQVIEAVVKTLDPNVPHMRELVVQSATSILHDLVKIYPVVDFSSSSQKLAVGTPEGATIVYDLQTATRSAVFEGHTAAVSAVKFSPDTKFVATGSLCDRSVRVWYTSVSLLGMFTSTFQSQSNRHGGISSQKSHKVFSFALPDTNVYGPDAVGFEWSSNRSVKLRVKEVVMSFNV
ncbi:hypothetical protein BC940DRAFT_293069 [Gongronella butleri]|nr:hypothetical protein BC940DRAFT_293069 [Gongronella butleri]